MFTLAAGLCCWLCLLVHGHVRQAAVYVQSLFSATCKQAGIAMHGVVLKPFLLHAVFLLRTSGKRKHGGGCV
jgi:hypothetical protein